MKGGSGMGGRRQSKYEGKGGRVGMMGMVGLTGESRRETWRDGWCDGRRRESGVERGKV